MSLRAKFVLFLTIFALLFSLSIFTFNYINSQKLLKQELMERGKALVKGLAFSSEMGVLSEDTVFLEPILKGLMKERDVVHAGVYNLKGEKIASMEKEKIEVKIPEYAMKRCISCMKKISLERDYNIQKIYEISHISIKDSMYNFYFPITTTSYLESSVENKAQIIGIARISLSTERLVHERRHTILNAIIATLLVAFLGILLAIFGSTRITSPIKRLTEGARAIGEGNFSHRIKIKSSDELGVLANTFNRMAEELEKSYKRIEEYSKSLERMVEERTRELRDTQAQLIHSAKMATIGQIGAGVAHEINNPLTSILGYTQLLSSKLDKIPLEPEIFKMFNNYLDKIEKESLRCKGIVEKLLSFSRKPSEGLELFHVNKIIEDTLSLLRNQLTVNNIQVITDFYQELPPVKGIPNQIQQVFVNIIVNAKDAMPEGGILKISTSLEKDMVKISFSDTGHGIPQENLQRIFEPFFTTKSNKKSVGLGLAISFNIIREHGGEIKVESEVGKGTTFSIYLPPVKEK